MDRIQDRGPPGEAQDHDEGNGEATQSWPQDRQGKDQAIFGTAGTVAEDNERGDRLGLCSACRLYDGFDVCICIWLALSISVDRFFDDYHYRRS